MTASPARLPRYRLMILVFNEAALPLLLRRLDLLMQEFNGRPKRSSSTSSRDCNGIALRQNSSAASS